MTQIYSFLFITSLYLLIIFWVSNFDIFRLHKSWNFDEEEMGKILEGTNDWRQNFKILFLLYE